MSYPNGLSGLFEALNATESQDTENDELVTEMMAADDDIVDQDVKDEILADVKGDMEENDIADGEKKELEALIEKIPEDKNQPSSDDLKEFKKTVESFLGLEEGDYE